MPGLNYNSSSTTIADTELKVNGNEIRLLGITQDGGDERGNVESFVKSSDIASKTQMTTKIEEAMSQIPERYLVDYYTKTETYKKSEVYKKTEVDSSLSGKQDKLNSNGNVKLGSDNSLNVDNTVALKTDLPTQYWTLSTRLKPVDSNQDVEAHAFYASSDKSLKNNITEITDESISKVDKIKLVEFDWKVNSQNRHSYGVIAQDVEKVLPELVSKGDLLTVNYVPLLLLKIASLEKRLNDLENGVSRID